MIAKIKKVIRSVPFLIQQKTKDSYLQRVAFIFSLGK